MAQSKFTEGIRKAILEKLREGHYESTVIDYVGINQATYYDWLKRGREEADDPNSEYSKFARDVKRAKSEVEFEAVADIKAAGRDTWTAWAWFLERTRPEKFGRTDRTPREANTDKEVVVVELGKPPESPPGDKP